MYELLPPWTVTVTPESLSNDHARSNTGSAGDAGPERVMTAPGTITTKRVAPEHPFDLVGERVGVDEGEHGCAVDPLVVREAPVVVEPAVERTERAHNAGGSSTRACSMPTPRVRRKIAPVRPCRSMRRSRVAVPVLRVLAHRVEVAEERPHVLALRVPAAEVLVEGARLRHGVERRVGDEAVDPSADEQALLAVDLRPLHRALGELRLEVPGEGVERLVVVVVAVERLELDVAHRCSSCTAGGPRVLHRGVLHRAEPTTMVGACPSRCASWSSPPPRSSSWR